MALASQRLTLALALALSAALVVACGDSGGSTTSASFSTKGTTGSSTSGGGHGGSGGAGGNTGGGGGDIVISVGTGTGGGDTAGFDVQPTALQTIAVAAGQSTPTAAFAATLDGQPISAGWGVDKGNVATIGAGPSATATLTPTGNAGGLVNVTAGLNGKTVTRQVLVKLTATQNGGSTTNASEVAQTATDTASLTKGGGVGGVGGEGLGPGVTDGPTLTALASPSGDGTAQGLTFLYPYDKTVWPRGILAPLLQWSSSLGDADAIQIALSTTSGSFSYAGTFARPAILGATGKFIRHPIPQDVWEMATNSAGGKTDQLTVKLTIAKGGQAYGPIAETWTIAEARLTGTIYYQSYGTQLVQNYSGAVGGNKLFGGAVLSIRAGDTGPKLVAGKNGVADANCRVCHSVATGGSRLVVQHGDNYAATSAYDLGGATATETSLAQGTQFPAVYPDGSMMLTAAGQLLPLPVDATAIAVTGLAGVVSNLGQPAFSPDGARVVFNPLSGGASVAANQGLYAMAFDKTTSAFTGLTQVAKETSPARPAWPAFFPDSQSVVYHRQTVQSTCDGSLGTRSGTRAQIYWNDLSGTATPTALDQLNGVGYLPKLAAPTGVACSDVCDTQQSAGMGSNNGDHSDDANVNYEPTVAPIVSGGYAWVVFTSRRMYGSVATIGSFCSDPRGVDLINNITPKKLWVAAVDLSQAPGTDSSHPAFYLPAQELLAGNARAFWVLDPCQADGASCQTGDQCCNGYCEPNGTGGALICSNMPPNGSCSGLQEKCSTAADCCDSSNVCINGFCAQKIAQ